jgi:hypothetical protein
MKWGLSPFRLRDNDELEVRVSFFWDLYQDRKLDELDRRLERVDDETRQGRQQSTALLEEKIDRLALICRAMFELMQPAGGITDAQLAAKIQEIDERDGTKDGRMTRAHTVCPKCGAAISARFGRCLFCGYKDPAASPFL